MLNIYNTLRTRVQGDEMCWLMARFSITSVAVVGAAASYIYFLILLFTQEYLPIPIDSIKLLLKVCRYTTLYVATINKNERGRRFNDGGGVDDDLRK